MRPESKDHPKKDRYKKCIQYLAQAASLLSIYSNLDCQTGLFKVGNNVQCRRQSMAYEVKERSRAGLNQSDVDNERFDSEPNEYNKVGSAS